MKTPSCFFRHNPQSPMPLFFLALPSHLRRWHHANPPPTPCPTLLAPFLCPAPRRPMLLYLCFSQVVLSPLRSSRRFPPSKLDFCGDSSWSSGVVVRAGGSQGPALGSRRGHVLGAASATVPHRFMCCPQMELEELAGVKRVGFG